MQLRSLFSAPPRDRFNSLSGSELDRAQVACLLADSRRLCSLSGAVVSSRKGFDGAEPVARLGLLLSDTAASQRNALKELVQLVKPGIRVHDAVVSRRKASMEQSRLVVLPCAAASQKQGRCGAESVDEARSHAERNCCITKKCLEGLTAIPRPMHRISSPLSLMACSCMNNITSSDGCLG